MSAGGVASEGRARVTRAQRRFLKTMTEGGRACDLPDADATRAALLAAGLVRRPPGCAFVVLTPAGLAAVLCSSNQEARR